MVTKPQGTIWVCSDCLMKLANDESPDEPVKGEPEPWALWSGDSDITPGMLEEHECDNRDDCDCEHIAFSRSRCGGCGSYLGGDRYACIWWA